MRSTTIFAALAVAASLLGAGCAGRSATLTDRQFDDRAAAVCEDMWQRLARLDGTGGAMGRTLPIVDAAVTRLRRLRAARAPAPRDRGAGSVATTTCWPRCARSRRAARGRACGTS